MSNGWPQQPEEQQQQLNAALAALQEASVEKEVPDRIRLLQKAQQIVLDQNSPPECIGSCLDQFLSLQADPNEGIRRWLAFFLERVAFSKPHCVVRCLSTLLALVGDTDKVVVELGIKAACLIHCRALYWLSLNRDDLITQGQQSVKTLEQIQETIRGFLESDQPPRLFAVAARFAKVQVLVQTSSPVFLKVRIPPELRGIRCLQDFPPRRANHLDLEKLRQQAEQLVSLLCRLLEHPQQRRPHRAALLQCLGTICCQRPTFLRIVLHTWKRLLSTTGHHTSLAKLVCAEIQGLLASTVAAEWHPELIDMLHSVGVAGSLEALTSQAKLQRIFATDEKDSQENKLQDSEEPPEKKPRLHGNALLLEVEKNIDEDAVDADVLLSGDMLESSKRLAERFDWAMDIKEPLGHVFGPAMLASKVRNNVELAKLALASLDTLVQRKNLLKEKTQDLAVLKQDTGSLFGWATSGSMEKKKRDEKALPDPEIFLEITAPPDEDGPDSDNENIRRDPRGQMARMKSRDGNIQAGTEEVEEEHIVPLDAEALQLPKEAVIKGTLQLQLFEEILEGRIRMEKSLLRSSLTNAQAEQFELVSRQVAFHSAFSMKLPLPANIQRQMCRACIYQAFDTLATPTKDGTGMEMGPTMTANLIELFHAKFSIDVARWQDANEGPLEAGKTGVENAKAVPLDQILEPPRGVSAGGQIFYYAELFQFFIAEFEKRGFPKRDFRSFLNELPYIPAIAFKTLENQCRETSTRKMALLTVLSLIETRPSARLYGLRLLFQLAYLAGDDKSDIMRMDTIRLIINKIYSSTAGQAPMRWQLPHLTQDEAKAVIGDSDAGPPRSEEFVPINRLRSRYIEDVATLLLRSVAPTTAQFAFPVRVPHQVRQLVEEIFSGPIAAPKDRVWLYLALCIKRPVLLHSLVETFTLCDADQKDHLINSIEEAIKHIPASDPELLVLVQKATPETERLVLKVLHILMQTTRGKERLSKAYGEAVTRLYQTTKNPQLLVPVCDLLERKNLLDFLPAIVQLEQEQVQDAFRQLIHAKDPPISLSELLTELHQLNKPGEDTIPLKCSMQALNSIFNMKDQFEPKVYGIVIQSLVEEQGPLPTLFMRTVIQVVKELPRLSDFVVSEILPRLVRREIWDDAQMWKGFMIVLQQAFPTSTIGASRVLMTLPKSRLEDALVQHPDWKIQLHEFVQRQPAGTVPAHVRQLLL